MFSLLGDVFLMLPHKFFLAGMAAFFLAHLFTIAGFNQNSLDLSWLAALPIAAVAGAFSLMNGRIRAGLRGKGENELIIPVMGYAFILSMMWLAALSTLFRPEWGSLAAVLVSTGGGLFFLSDSVLAYNRFVQEVRHGEIIVMVTYHLAQLIIAAGALLQFAG